MIYLKEICDSMKRENQGTLYGSRKWWHLPSKNHTTYSTWLLKSQYEPETNKSINTTEIMWVCRYNVIYEFTKSKRTRIEYVGSPSNLAVSFNVRVYLIKNYFSSICVDDIYRCRWVLHSIILSCTQSSLLKYIQGILFWRMEFMLRCLALASWNH